MQSATGRFAQSLASGRTLHKVLFVMRPQPTPTPTGIRRAMSTGDKVAMLLTLFGSQFTADAAVEVTRGILRPPSGGLPGWVLLLAVIALAVSAVVTAVAAVRFGRVSRAGSAGTVLSGVLAGLATVAFRQLMF